MANFSVANSTAIGAGNVQQAISATYKSLLVAGNSSATTAAAGGGFYRRGKLYDILVGTNGTPADNYMEFDVALATLGTTPAGITGSLVSSVSSNFGLDPADTTFISALQINSTAEVGITANTEKWFCPVNQRASYRWVAAPGSEIVYPANSSGTGNNALVLRARSGGYTGTAGATILVNEQ